MPVIHRFPCTIAAGGNAGNVTSANWNDAHIYQILSVAYSANGSIPAWGDTTGQQIIELAECTGTITLTLPSLVGFFGFNPPPLPIGMHVEFHNTGTGVITIEGENQDGTTFTYELANQGQAVEIYASSATGYWTVRWQSA